MQTHITFPFSYASPFNYDLARQFILKNNLKDDFFEALELQIRNGSVGMFSSWSAKTAVDEIRIEFRKANLSKHEAIMMYLSRLYELKPMWWNNAGMRQLDELNSLVDEISHTMRSKMLQIVENGLVTNQIPIQTTVQKVTSFANPQQVYQVQQSFPHKPTEPFPQEFYQTYPHKTIESTRIPEVKSTTLEPLSPELFTMEEMNMIVHTDYTGKENDLIIHVRNMNHVSNEKQFGFRLKESNRNTKIWTSSIILEEEGKYEISLEHFGKIIFTTTKQLNQRKISLHHSISKSNWDKKCRVGEDCTFEIPCLNSINSNIFKQFNIDDIRAIVRCANKEFKCNLSFIENRLCIQFQSDIVGNAFLNISFEDQHVDIPFTIEYREVNWNRTILNDHENLQIQDSKWIVTEKRPVKLTFKIFDMKERPIDLFDASLIRARLQTLSGNIMEVPIEFISEQSCIQVSFIVPSNLGPSILSFSNTQSTLQKFPIEISKARTLQVAIFDQTDGIAESVKERFKEKALKCNLNLNIIQKSHETQKPDIVLRFIYHNGPPTWSDFKKILADDHKKFEGASVIMILATLNKQYWKMDSPDDSFPSGVNLTHSNNSIRKRGVVWIHYDYNRSIASLGNESEIEHLVQLMSLKI